MQTVSKMSEQSTDVSPELKSVGFNRKELRCEIGIDSPPERVWEILIDFERFPEWNPFIRQASGRIEANERLTVTMHPSGGRRTTFRPSILKVEPNKELRWLGHLGFPGVFDGQHIFELQPSEDRKTLFIQREEFCGILLPFLTGMLRKETARGFVEMNLALKKRAEGRTT